MLTYPKRPVYFVGLSHAYNLYLRVTKQTRKDVRLAPKKSSVQGLRECKIILGHGYRNILDVEDIKILEVGSNTVEYFYT